MAKSTALTEHVAELLAPLGGIQIKSMFGAFGVFHRGNMIGIIDDDVLYLKTDDQNRADFTERHRPRFTYPSKKGPMELPYYQAPDECLDDSDTMVEWARKSVEVAKRKKAGRKTVKKTVKKKKKR